MYHGFNLIQEILDEDRSNGLVQHGSVRNCMSNKALMMCNDFQVFNNTMARYQCPTSSLDDMILGLIGSCLPHIKIDCKNRCHRLSMRVCHEYNNALNTTVDFFDWLDTHFGLSRSPSFFMRSMNSDLHALLGEFAFVYFDEICCGKSLGVHTKHLRLVSEALRKE